MIYHSCHKRLRNVIMKMKEIKTYAWCHVCKELTEVTEDVECSSCGTSSAGNEKFERKKEFNLLDDYLHVHRNERRVK